MMNGGVGDILVYGDHMFNVETCARGEKEGGFNTIRFSIFGPYQDAMESGT